MGWKTASLNKTREAPYYLLAFLHILLHGVVHHIHGVLHHIGILVIAHFHHRMILHRFALVIAVFLIVIHILMVILALIFFAHHFIVLAFAHVHIIHVFVSHLLVPPLNEHAYADWSVPFSICFKEFSLLQHQQ
jgi:hypothetical protein